MTMKDAAPMLKEMIGLIHERIAEAAEAATAAKACASVNNLDEAIRITLAIEQPLYEANMLMNAASLIKRLSNDA